MNPKVTKIIVLSTVGAIIVYDIIAFATGGVDSTISRVVLGWSRENPFAPFAAGVVCGHLFWPQKGTKP